MMGISGTVNKGCRSLDRLLPLATTVISQEVNGNKPIPRTIRSAISIKSNDRVTLFFKIQTDTPPQPPTSPADNKDAHGITKIRGLFIQAKR
jgi:hypothetical protein